MTPLTHRSTLDRDLVHRHAIGEVFVTDTRGVDDDTFEVAAQLPRSHAFHTDHPIQPAPVHDPLIVAEACRQAGILGTQRYIGAADDAKFVVQTFDTRVLDPGLLAMGDRPLDAVIRCRILERITTDGRLTGINLEYVVVAAGGEAFRMETRYTWVTPEVWGRLRARSREKAGLNGRPAVLEPPVRTDPALVARVNAYNVVLAPVRVQDGRHEAQLVVDTGHPTLFDHPLDHLPGMLQLEAMRQIAIAAAAERGHAPPETLRLHALATRLERFGELDLPATVRCTLRPPDGTEVTADVEILQAGSRVSAAEVVLALPTGAAR